MTTQLTLFALPAVRTQTKDRGTPVATANQGPAPVSPRGDTKAATPRPPVKYGSDLNVGDIIRFLSSDYSITALPAYPNPHLFDFMDDRWRVAWSGKWGMTIDPDALWAQLDNAVWVSAHHYPDQDISFGVPRSRPKPVTHRPNNLDTAVNPVTAPERRPA